MGNLTFYRSWTPRMTPRSSATHAPWSGLISTDALSPLKGLSLEDRIETHFGIAEPTHGHFGDWGTIFICLVNFILI